MGSRLNTASSNLNFLYNCIIGLDGLDLPHYGSSLCDDGSLVPSCNQPVSRCSPPGQGPPGLIAVASPSSGFCLHREPRQVVFSEDIVCCFFLGIATNVLMGDPGSGL